MSKFEFSEQAEIDLLETVTYISQHNALAAETWLNKIISTCYNISQSPLMGRERPELGRDIRSFPIGRFIIFYRPIETGMYVVRVLRGSMNLDQIFEK
ncbi:MAG: type II toxin-antitoxin system RelE/ParE family toxin [Magnetococcales bacterium]|nr:type II toxin-antitoxin system RelE/ParE family toxin [Magnetococcales bacterium]